MLRLAAALGLAAVLCLSCSHKIDPGQSPLLDNARAYYLGAADQKESPGKVVVWDADYFLISGRRKPVDAPKDARSSAFLWLVDASGKILWDKSVDSLEIFDLAVLDSARALVLLNPPDKTARDYQLWTVNRAGKIVSRATEKVPDGLRAARLMPLSPEHLLVTAWKQNADSTALECTALHVGLNGQTPAAKWDYPAEKFYPLKNGDFLAKREHKDKKLERDLLVELARIRPDGSLVYKRENPLDTLKAELRGVAETSDGGLLLALVAGNRFETTLARLSAAGDLMFIQRLDSLAGFQPYSMVPWGTSRYLIAAQAPLTGRSVDGLAAIVVDEQGRVLDSDVRPDGWSFPTGGVLPAGNGRFIITGIGGADSKLGTKQPDIALYVLDTTPATAAH